MLQKHLQFSFAFALIFIAQIIMVVDQKFVEIILLDFHYVIKPMITISLMIFLGYQTELKTRFSKRIFAGLLFGLVGDSFLMFVTSNPQFFIYGLIAFLIGHLLYISAFYLDYKWNPVIHKIATRWALVIFGIFCLGFYWFLRPHLGSMKIPVMIYAFVISLMAIMAVNRKGRVNSLSFNFVFCGVILFLISDSLLAYHKFVVPFKYAQIVIMATYMLAQYSITVGAIERRLKKHSVMKSGS